MQKSYTVTWSGPQHKVSTRASGVVLTLTRGVPGFFNLSDESVAQLERTAGIAFAAVAPLAPSRMAAKLKERRRDAVSSKPSAPEKTEPAKLQPPKSKPKKPSGGEN